jgi:hypothetical protein
MLTVLGEDDTFVKMLQRAALEFKSAMLLGLSEVARGIEEMLPDTAKTRGFKLMAGAAANQMEIRGNIAADDAAAATRGGARSFGDIMRAIEEEMRGMVAGPGLDLADQMEKEALLQRIFTQRSNNLAARGADAPVVAPAGQGGTGPKAAFDPTGMLAGGIANAISRITGGGDILLTKQLATQEGTRAAAEKTAEEAKRTADAVEKLVTQTNPRRPRGAAAVLTL